MNKPSTKTIFFAASMYYSERLVQELKERLSKNLMKYGFNNWFAVVGGVSAYDKILFFSSFLFFNYDKGETNEPLGSKKTKHHIVKQNDKMLLDFHLWEWH